MLAAGFSPLAVLTQPDRKAGRGLKLQQSPVKQVAVESGIAVHQPESLRSAAFLDWLTDLEPDLMVVVAYGLILPQAVLDVPRLGCWNIHASLLPRWRGAAPIQRAIEAGDSHSGVCIMQMDAGLDTGAVLASCSTPLAHDETGGSLHDRLAQMGADTLLQCLQRLEAGQGSLKDLDTVARVCDCMAGKTLCPFGDAAITPALSTMKKFGRKESHITRRELVMRAVISCPPML